ncbi:MAG TPA: hypothetical protein VKS01_04155, partial [Bryobacteraceae bacterium]|nr:hypothetical protein [Bryobacteraceae bacterium]
SGFAMTHIAANGKSYSDSPSGYMPLRLQEARAAIFDPLPAAVDTRHDAVRTAPGIYNGKQVACVLLSGAMSTAQARQWEETEACVDPQSGLLETFSQVPGRYFAYEYSNDAQGRTSLTKVTVTEAGRTVSEIKIDSLTPLAALDPAAFTPAAEMIEKGRAIGTAGATKASYVYADAAVDPGATVRPVVVFGLITPAGKLVEAHSLQPSDPNSQAAVDAANRISFSPMPSPPRQRFAFILEKFVEKPVSGN